MRKLTPLTKSNIHSIEGKTIRWIAPCPYGSSVTGYYFGTAFILEVDLTVHLPISCGITVCVHDDDLRKAFLCSYWSDKDNRPICIGSDFHQVQFEIIEE